MKLMAGALALILLVPGCGDDSSPGPTPKKDSGTALDAPVAIDTALVKPDSALVKPDTLPPVDQAVASDTAASTDALVGTTCAPINNPCSPGLVCNLLECSFKAKGVCVFKPLSCPPVIAPVCGCGGVTFQNDCLRLQAGIGLAAQGACPPITG